MHPEGWREDAPCREIGLELFFGYDGETKGEKRARVPAAKKFCVDTCPVISECLLFALQGPEEFGVFGGLNQRERRDILAGQQKLPEWADERHEEVVRAHRIQTGSLEASGEGGESNFAASLAAKTSQRMQMIEQTMELTAKGRPVSQIAKILGTTTRSISRYRAQAREMSAAA